MAEVKEKDTDSLLKCHSVDEVDYSIDLAPSLFWLHHHVSLISRAKVCNRLALYRVHFQEISACIAVD